MKLLLHACCAPCCTSCLPAFLGEGIQPDIFWYNPNIHPYGEYSLRRRSLIKFADNEGLKLKMIDEYGLKTFLSEVMPENNGRCLKCYTLRLEKTAFNAAQDGYTAFTTSLLVSPYQDHDAIRRIGEQTAEKYGVEFLYKDFRPFFREGQTQARVNGCYMQKYCGCIFSEEERFLQRKEKGTALAKPADNGHIFQRLELITGKKGLEKLKNTKVLVFGLGGVGSWAAQALVRSGIGKIGIIDSDAVCDSNINRQSEATTLTIGQPKAQTLKKQLLEINPDCEITAWNELFRREKANLFDIESADYVIDAIDSLNHKLDLIETVCSAGVSLFSSMGMALKMDPSMIRIAPFWKTTNCPLARLVRQGLRKRGFFSDFTVVYSAEKPIRAENSAPANGVKHVNGSVVTVTATAGLYLASLVLRDITEL
ncbi:MAG: epoxyqueuosine reductase QueH [Treponema sp.]|jgi:tRNA A37 threonylcarbamoyladenosine dehydratase/predicted adenine nucleotide alpha hydrolase (AANH) superfamily ATPase|nr:epoxyqueuosine reductase QueH [Treponema sp.]